MANNHIDWDKPIYPGDPNYSPVGSHVGGSGTSDTPNSYGAVASDDINPNWRSNNFLGLTYGDGLTFSTAGMSSDENRDLRNNLASIQSQINAQLAYIQWQTWYNSEAQKIQRMRSAGLNPDLLGLESASESSGNLAVDGVDVAGISQAEIARKQQVAMQRAAEIQTAISIAGTIVSAVTSVFSVVGSVASIGVTQATKSLIQEQTNAQKLQNYSSVRNTAASLWLDQLTALVGDVGATKFDDISSDILENSFKSAAASITGDSDIDRMIRREMNAMKNNPEMLSNYYAQRQALVSNMLKSAEAEAHPNFNRDYVGMVNAFAPLVESSYKVLSSDVEKQLSELQYHIDYYKTLDGSLKAASENALNAYTKEFQEALDPAIASQLQNLTNKEAYEALNYKFTILSGYYEGLKGAYARSQQEGFAGLMGKAEFEVYSKMYSFFGVGTDDFSLTKSIPLFSMGK